MTTEQIKEYLNKYSLTTKEKLAQHILELKRNTKPNLELISELNYVLIDDENLFFNLFCENNTKDYWGIEQIKRDILSIVGDLEDVNKPPQRTVSPQFLDEVLEHISLEQKEVKTEEENKGLSTRFKANNVVKKQESEYKKIMQEKDKSNLLLDKRLQDELYKSSQKEMENDIKPEAVSCSKGKEESKSVSSSFKLFPDTDFYKEHLKIVGNLEGVNKGHSPHLKANTPLPPHQELDFSEMIKDWSDRIVGLKENNGKTDYSEINLGILDLMAERFAVNKHKYPHGNMKKFVDIKSLEWALFRHIKKMLQPIEGDIENYRDHLSAILCNSSMILDQLELNILKNNLHNSK